MERMTRLELATSTLAMFNRHISDDILTYIKVIKSIKNSNLPLFDYSHKIL